MLAVSHPLWHRATLGQVVTPVNVGYELLASSWLGCSKICGQRANEGMGRYVLLPTMIDTGKDVTPFLFILLPT